MRTISVQKPIICDRCFQTMNPVFFKFEINKKIDGLAIYKYDDFLKEKLFLLKGCYDIEIAPIFLVTFARYLKTKYHGYVIVPVPSYIKHDEIRGFNHVIEIFRCMEIEYRDILLKTSPLKQSDQPINKRSLINDILEINDGECLKNKKVLIVDDVYTTGMTIKKCIDLIEKFNPKSIKVLVLSKVEHKEETSL